MTSATLQNVVDQLQENKRSSEDTTASVEVVASLIRQQIESSRLMAENNSRNRVEAGRESRPGGRSVMGEVAATGGNAAAGTAGGLIGMGAGIAGFMAALSVGSMGLKWLGNDYSGLGDAFASFSNAIVNLSPAATIAFAGVAAIAAKTASFKNLYGLGTASGMTGIGAGISGFLIGLALGDPVLGWIGTDYSNLGKALGSFSEAITSLTPEATLLMGGIAALAIANTAFGGDAKSLALSMTGLAVGIAGFLGGLVLTEYALTWVGNDYSNLGGAFASFSAAIGMLTPAAVTFLGAVAAIAIGASAFGKGPLTIAAGMAGLGVGIAAFMGALAFGEKGISWIGAIPDGSGKGLVSTFKIFNDAVLALTPESIIALGAIIVAGTAIGAIPGGPIMVATGMLGIGAGISAFMAALALGDKGISWIGAIPEGSGKGLVSTFQMFNDAIMALSPDAMKAMGVLMLASPAGAAVAVGLPLIGVGLAGFIGALAVGDVIAAVAAWSTGGEAGASLKQLLVNIFTGVAAASGVKGLDLLSIAGGITAIAGSLIAFSVGDLVGTLVGVGKAILGFFGVESPFGQIMALAEKAESLTVAASALEVIAGALGKFGAISFDSSKMNFKEMAEQLGYAIPTLAALATGGPVAGSAGWITGPIVFPEGGILNPNLKLDEMADAIAKVNYVLGQTTTYPVNAQAIPSTSGADLSAANTATQAITYMAPVTNNYNTYHQGGQTSIMTMPVSTVDNNGRR